MRQLNTRILQNKKIAQDFYKMQIESLYLAKKIKPGQFVHVRCSDSSGPLLRRPFSVHRILKKSIEILYEVVGRGTEALSQRKRDEYLNVIGPLGTGFDLNAICYPLNAILVAGGMGVAPLVALAEELAYSVERIAYRKRLKTYIIISARTKSHILCEKDFRKSGCKVLIATEDGSKGEKGLATDLLQGLLNAKRYPLYATIYACGPNEMLREVARIARARRISCQVSLEERMACGVGVCLGCPIKVRQFASSLVRQLKPANRQTSAKNLGGSADLCGGDKPANYTYKMVCKDGPVFNAEEIAW